jgi:hypothetical protein
VLHFGGHVAAINKQSFWPLEIDADCRTECQIFGYYRNIEDVSRLVRRVLMNQDIVVCDSSKDSIYQQLGCCRGMGVRAVYLGYCAGQQAHVGGFAGQLVGNGRGTVSRWDRKCGRFSGCV